MEERDREILENLRLLLQHPGWAWLVDVLHKQTVARMRENFSAPIVSIEDALRRNHAQGVIDGMRFVRKLPEQVVRLKEEEFKEWLESEQ